MRRHDKAALDIQDQLCERAAQLWEVKAEQIKYEDGTLSSGDRSISFKELAGKLDETGGPVVGRASVNPDSGVGGSFAWDGVSPALVEWAIRTMPD